MLSTSSTNPDGLDDANPAASTTTTAAVGQTLRIIRRRKSLLVAGLALSLLIGGAYYASAERIYEAKAGILVHQTGEAVSGAQLDVTSGRPNYIPTHIRLILSAAVLNKAVGKIKPDALGDLAGAAAEDRASVLAKRLKVSSERDTEIIEIGYRTAEPRTASAVVDAVVAAYLEFVNETHRSTSKEILVILTQQKEELEKQLLRKEADLVALQQSSGVLALRDEKTNIMVARVTALNDALTRARMRRLEAAARLKAVQAAIEKGEPIDTYALRFVQSLGQEMVAANLGLGSKAASPLDDTARKELLQDQLELQRLEGTYGPNHPRLQAVRERLQLFGQIVDENSAASSGSAHLREDLGALVLGLLDNELAEATELEKQLAERFEQEKAQALELNASGARLVALEAEVNRLRSFYDTLTNRIKQVNLGEDYGAITTRVVEPPKEPRFPISPSLRKSLTGSTLVGLVIGVGLCYLFEWWDTSYRGPEDIAQHLGVAVVGHIPRVGRLPLRDGQPASLDLLAYHAPRSPETEAFRTLRAALTLSNTAVGKLAVTSPEPGDGKTTILSNLAISFAQAGLRTLIVDADMRRPRMRSIFSLPRGCGLSMLLETGRLSEDEIARAVQRTEIDGLEVLPSGPNPPNPAELLESENLRKILEWAESRYDRVLVDSPPILAVSDCALVTRVLDGVLLVVRTDKNDRVMTGRARDMLHSMNCRVLGVVVNDVNPQGTYGDYYYRKGRYGYYYRYHKHYYSSQAEGEPAEPAPGLSGEAPGSVSLAEAGVGHAECA